MISPPEKPGAQRWVSGQLVRETEDGRLFIVTQGIGDRGGRRHYGTIQRCDWCEREFFRLDRDAIRGRQLCCSRSCGKKGEFNPTRQRTQDNPKQTADKLFSELVRMNGRCLICGTRDGRLECAHGFSRRYLAIRWDRRNAFCLCARCHRHYTGRPLEWDDWLLKRWGEALYNELRSLALEGARPDYDSLLPALRAELTEAKRQAARWRS